MPAHEDGWGSVTPDRQPAGFAQRWIDDYDADPFGVMVSRITAKMRNAGEVESAHKLVGMIVDRLGGELWLTMAELVAATDVHYDLTTEYVEEFDSIKLVATRREPRP